MRLFFLFCLIFEFLSPTFGQTAYEVNLISKDLLPRASAVVRNAETVIEVQSLDQVSYKYKKAITILNKNGDEDAAIYIWYNKSRSIKSIKGLIYDEFGKPVSKIVEKEFRDVSAADDNSLFEDSRLKMFQPAVNNYPYTIEYEYEVRARQSLNFPDWFPNEGTGVAIENASLTFRCKPNFNIRFKEINYKGKAEIENTSPTKTYKWQIQNIKAIREEPYSPNYENFLTSVKIAPEQFDYLGIKGSFTNWTEMGTWIFEKLLKDRKELPEATLAHIRELTKALASPREKAQKIYEYVQQKTRYISVQVGIGGYQPILANQVDRTAYGDCKGLVNYTQALLAAVDIPSYYTLVASGSKKRSALPDFASMNQFDHVILCIPFEKDTAWVDCTSKDSPFGFLGTFTDDRLVLACTPNGGELLRTPKFEESKNLQIRNASFLLDNEGNLSGTMKTSFEGFQYDNRSYLIHESKEERIKMLASVYRIDQATIQSLDIKQNKSPNPVTEENLSLKIRNYAVVNRESYLLPLNQINQSSTPKEINNRQNQLYINRGYTDIDEIEYLLPAGLELDIVPVNIQMQKAFGSFSTQIKAANNKVTYTRKIHVKEGFYPATAYAEFVSFFQSVKDADQQKIRLKKTN
jgi:hypothetical protein